jgi:DNA-directed RNA polymerase subunit RPC12/RpoP
MSKRTDILFRRLYIKKLKDVITKHFSPDKIPYIHNSPQNGLIRHYCNIYNREYPTTVNPNKFLYNEALRFGSPIYIDYKALQDGSLKKTKVFKKLAEKKPKKVKVKKQPYKGEWWDKYHKYINSAAWKAFKSKIKRERGNKCEKCGSDKFILDCHHLTYVRLFNELPDDVQILCRPCHRAHHKKHF